MALYTKLHSEIAQHRSVLSEREKSLHSVKESLVRDGGAVVGSAPADGGQDT